MSEKGRGPRPARRRSARGTLAVIAVLLIGSAVLRLGNTAGQALARASEDADTAADVPAPGQQRSCETPADLQTLLSALQAREARVTEKEGMVRNRMEALRIADEEVSGKLAELEQAEEALRETIALAEKAAEGDLLRLTKVYESMKPKQAAALFEEMAPEFAAGFIGRMRPEAAAAIMAGLTPEAAHRFSVVLAGRNAEVPRD